MRTSVHCLTVTLAILLLVSSATAFDLLNDVDAAHDPVGNGYVVARRADSGGIECFRVDAGGSIQGSKITLSSADAESPEIAYDSVLGRFLVIWTEIDSSSGYSVYSVRGRLVTTAGATEGDEIVIVDSLSDAPRARLAYSAHTGRYFVAFRNDTAFQGRFVAGDGTPDGAAFDVISGDSHPDFSHALTPAVECDTVNHRFLVVGIVYGFAGIPPLSIYGALVDDADPVTIHKATSPVYISSTYLYPPSLAFDAANERFLMVWEYYTGSGHDLWGQVIGADGSLSGSAWKIVSSPSVGFANDVVFKPADGRYLVAWLDDRDNGPLTMYGQEVTVDGTNHGAEFQISPIGYQYNLALTHNPVSKNTLLSWGGNQRNHFLVTPTPPKADLEVTITAPEQVLAGGRLHYVVTTRNLGGDDATNAMLTITIPESAQFISGAPTQGEWTITERTVTLELGTLASGASATMTLEVILPTPEVVTATTAISSDALDTNTANNTAGVDVTVATLFTVSPTRGTAGTEIEIVGPDFGTKKGKVKLVGPDGSKTLKILSWNEEGKGVIRAVVKKTPIAGTYSLLVKPKGADEILETDAFEIVAPGITKSPKGAGLGETRTMEGTCFGTKKKSVFIEYTKGEKTKRKALKVLSWPEDSASGTATGEITFRLPKKLPFGNWKLVVKTKAGEHSVPFSVWGDG